MLQYFVLLLIRHTHIIKSRSTGCKQNLCLFGISRFDKPCSKIGTSYEMVLGVSALGRSGMMTDVSTTERVCLEVDDMVTESRYYNRP